MNSCQLPVRCRMMPAKTRQRNPTPVMRWVFIIWFVNFKERVFLYFQKTDLTFCLIFIIVFLSSLMFPGNVIWWREAGSGSTEPQKCGRRLRSCCPQHNWSLFISALKKKTYISDKLNTYCCWSQMKWPLHGYFFSSCMFPYFLFYISLCTTGLENAKRENHQEAFTCFLAAAQQGYSKAQFNVAVCYEKGRGVSKNKEKVRPRPSLL